ncbi:MAG: carboxypeptidase-like regulatory domain-containing protein [Bacteroidales bacterium]|nr:carboxypeptidase-like regulatory domain-containing protein [Bacteroidales bacterium]
MTTIQETRLNMYLTVRDFLIQKESITKDLPNFGTNFNILKEAINGIQSFAELQKSDKTGLARHKNELREKLTTLSLDNSRKITAFAKFSDNTLLHSEVKFTASSLSKATDTGLKDYAQIVYDKAQVNIEALPLYGITPDTQKIFLETITAYNESISKPRLGLTEKSQATKQLVKLFDTADLMIENIDLAVEIIRLNQTDFYNGYKTARKIVETSAGYLTLKALATDKKNGEPVRGAIFTFKIAEGNLKAGNVNGEIVKKTAEKGRFHIKNMPAGTYQVVITKPGYSDKTEKVIVSGNEMTDLRVEMEKI